MAITPEEIDLHLPQTQCGLCGYGGCLPYAQALVQENAAINLCPPGGVKTLQTLAELLQQDARPHLAEMQENTKPYSIALIREGECIGCTKCIQACPVDAIMGSAKHMHTVLSDECTGCELCIAPCPVDCIEMIQSDKNADKAEQFRQRYQAHSERLARNTLKDEKPKVLSPQEYLQAMLQRKKLSTRSSS
jgi:electron transport complex protein RnfB